WMRKQLVPRLGRACLPGWKSPTRWRAALGMLGGAARVQMRRRSRFGQSTVRSASWKTRLPAEARRKANFLVATNVPAMRKSAEEVLRLYKAQSGVDRGFAFRNRSLVLSLLGVRKVGRARDGDRIHHGALPARLSAGRIAHPTTSGRDKRHSP